MKKRHPFTLLLYTIGTFFCIIFTNQWLLLLTSLLFGLLLLIKLHMLSSLKSLLLLLSPLLLFTIVFQPLLVHKGSHILFYLFHIPVQIESCIYALISAIMLCSVCLWTICFSQIFTFDRLLYLCHYRLPSIALIFSMVFRFIPLCKQQFAEVHLHSLIPIAEPISKKKQMQRYFKEITMVISWSLEHAMQTAQSMRAKGYGTKKRTFYQSYPFLIQDVILCACSILFFVLTGRFFLQGYAQANYFPIIQNDQIPIPLLLLYICWFSLPFILECLERKRRYA